MNIILGLIASVGLTFIILQGRIFKEVRLLLSKVQIFKELLSCSMCTGFWTGIFNAIIIGLNLPQIFLFGLASSFLSYFFFSLFEYLDEVIFKK